MKTILRTYSHPVLGNGDDFSSRFDVLFGVEVSEDRSNWVIVLTVDMDNLPLRQLIDTGFAAYHLEVECAGTFYRQLFDTREQTAQFTIPATRLRARVQLDAFIAALKPIPDYKPAQAHEDYGSRAYSISKGEILGVGGTWSFVADLDFDPLRASASSFIKIERGPDPKGNMVVQHGTDDIIIRLAQEDYDRFQSIAGQKLVADILHAVIVFPVLVEAVRLAQKGHNDHNDRLVSILEQRTLMNEDPFVAAQSILKAPVSRALAKLVQIKEAES